VVCPEFPPGNPDFNTQEGYSFQEENMTSYAIDPEDIISDFLRVKLTDPNDRAEDSNSDTFAATAAQTDFTLTPTSGTSVSCVTAVTVEGAGKVKWKDYVWDYQNQKLVFFTGITKDDVVIVTYKEGSTNWIFSDEPDERLAESGWPRISIFTVSGGAVRLGNYEAPVKSSPNLQIDVWAKNGQVFTIGGKKYSNKYLSRYIALQITKAFEDNENDLYPAMFDYVPIGVPRTGPYSNEYQAHHTIIEVNFSVLDMGRVDT